MVTLVPFGTILMVLTTMCQGPLGRDKNRLTGDIIHCIEKALYALQATPKNVKQARGKSLLESWGTTFLPD